MAGEVLTHAEALTRMEMAANEGGPALARALDLAASQALGPIMDSWPVATGESLAGWRAITTASGGSILNTVDYASDVHDGLADQLVVQAVGQLDFQIRRDTEEPITAILEGE